MKNEPKVKEYLDSYYSPMFGNPFLCFTLKNSMGKTVRVTFNISSVDVVEESWENDVHRIIMKSGVIYFTKDKHHIRNIERAYVQYCCMNRHLHREMRNN